MFIDGAAEAAEEVSKAVGRPTSRQLADLVHVTIPTDEPLVFINADLFHSGAQAYLPDLSHMSRVLFGVATVHPNLMLTPFTVLWSAPAILAT